MTTLGDTSSFETVSSEASTLDENDYRLVLNGVGEPTLGLQAVIEASRARADKHAERIKRTLYDHLTLPRVLKWVVKNRELGCQYFTLDLCDWDSGGKREFSHLIDYQAIYEETVKPLLLQYLDPEMFRITGRYTMDGNTGRRDYEVQVRWLEPRNSFLYKYLCFPMGC